MPKLLALKPILLLRDYFKTSLKKITRGLNLANITNGTEISNLDIFINKIIDEISSLDNYLSSHIIDEKTYKLRLNGRAKSFMQNLKTNSYYTPNYISKIITKVRHKIRELDVAHPMLKYFKLTRDEYKQIAYENSLKTKEKNTYKKSFNKSEFLTLTEELLQSNRFELLYMGLLLASGRRSLEIIAGQFINNHDSDTISFKGQLKTRNIKRFNTPYSIPLTVDKQLFLEAYNKLVDTNQYKDLRDRWEDNELKDTSINTLLRHELAKLFEGEFLLSDFRAIYTAIILKREGYFNDNWGAKEIYPRVAEILGHVDDESASVSYRDFKLTNSPTIANIKVKINYIIFCEYTIPYH
ncbi:hypothetical protein CR532_04450 [Candidatus Borreliella tachyglossi]|uniref:Telomere resolvase ResT/TelK catalytic domain-containing protein n=1 Tax=Candidatus Borreliella tachyglossi TaxID=1964448 RepID=A0A2S1LY15_9SPIR|nr:protelomerase family protein [Candidatus Borreliella tachyglossi]AWG43189.1 hypothetical protein CR532_04450 [Candidatus Borreliella tachyglossi]